MEVEEETLYTKMSSSQTFLISSKYFIHETLNPGTC